MDNLKNHKFGKLTVLSEVKEKVKGGSRIFWICECECGNIKKIQKSSILRGDTKSCGSQLHKIKHGKSNLRLYRIFKNMEHRCYNPTNISYKSYGGKEKPVKVCDEWRGNFQIFYDWALNNGYEEHLTLDRIDSDKDYTPDNCRWVTFKENYKNRKIPKHEEKSVILRSRYSRNNT